MRDKIYIEILNDLYCCFREIDIPNFQIALVVKSGSMKEKSEQSGIAHCLEHINLLWDKHEQNEYFYGHGYTNYFETVYILNCQLSDFERAIQIIDNIISGAYINQKLLDEAVIDVIKEIKKSGKRDAEIYKILFDDDLLLEKMPVGKESDVSVLSIEDIKKFYLENYKKNNMAICVVSSLGVNKYLDLIRQRIGLNCINDVMDPYRYCPKSDKCIVDLEKHNSDYEILIYKYVNINQWLPNEIKYGYDFFLDILRIKLYDFLSLEYDIIGITCSLKKFYQANRILKIRIVVKDNRFHILHITPEILGSQIKETQINSIKSEYYQYISCRKIFLQHEDIINECINAVLGLEKMTSIDDERKLINSLLNLTNQEIEYYLNKLFAKVKIIRIDNLH